MEQLINHCNAVDYHYQQQRGLRFFTNTFCALCNIVCCSCVPPLAKIGTLSPLSLNLLKQYFIIQLKYQDLSYLVGFFQIRMTQCTRITNAKIFHTKKHQRTAKKRTPFCQLLSVNTPTDVFFQTRYITSFQHASLRVQPESIS